jgi:hypothetical protein
MSRIGSAEILKNFSGRAGGRTMMVKSNSDKGATHVDRIAPIASKSQINRAVGRSKQGFTSQK